MKNIFLLLTLIFTMDAFSQGEAPLLMKGQDQTTNQVGAFLQVPFQQVTRLNSSTGLLETGNRNILANPDFEHQTATTGWTTVQSSGTFTSASSSTAFAGKKSILLSGTSGEGTFTQCSTLNAAQFENVQGYVGARIKTTVASMQVCSMVDNDERDCVPVVANDLWNEYKIPTVFGATCSGLRVKTTSAVTGSIFVDDAIASPTSLVGSVDLISEWKSYTPSSTQGLGTPVINDCKYREVGTSIEIQCDFTTGTTTAVEARLGLPSGMTVQTGATKKVVGLYIRAGVGSRGGSVMASGGQTYVTFGVGDFDGTNNANGSVAFASSERELFFASVPVNNLTGKINSYVEQSDWQIDANIGGANPSLGTSSVSAYTGIENGSLDMVLRPWSAPAEIGCSSTNAPSGLTCASGSESLSVSFVPPSTGKYEVCFNLSHYREITGASTATSVFQVVETAINSQTIISEGGDIAQGTNANFTSVSVNPVYVCGVFTVTDTNKKMFRLMYEQQTSGTVVAVLVLADRSSVNGQRDISVRVRRLSSTIVGTFKGYNKSEGAINPKICSYWIGDDFLTPCSASPCNVFNVVGNCVASVARNAAGEYRSNWVSGYWSQQPSCVATLTSSSQDRIGISSVNALTSIDFRMRVDSTGVTTDRVTNVICHGQ